MPTSTRITVVRQFFSWFVVIRLFRSASSCPYRKDGLFGGKICNSLWLVKEFNRLKAVLGFVSSEDLPWHFFGVLLHFGVFRTISDIVFKADILPSDDFFEWQVSCASPTLSFQWQLQCWSDIGYKYWKWSALRNITSRACETKPTVCKQKQMQSSLNEQEWMVQSSQLNSAHAHGLAWKKLPLKQWILLLWP